MTNEAKFTPGPWKCWHSGYANAPEVIYTGNLHPILGKRGEVVCVPGTYIAEVSTQHMELDAADNWIEHNNARLIAAAPELYEALREIMLYVSDMTQDEGGARLSRLMNIEEIASAALSAAGGQ